MSNKTELEAKLAGLQVVFKNGLEARLHEIESLCLSILSGSASESDLIVCHRQVHSLVGSGGTFGAVAVSTVARKIEQILKALIDNKNADSYLQDNHKTIESLLAELRHVAEKWEVSAIPYIPQVVDDVKKEWVNKLIYITEDDELFAVNLVTQLEQDGFIVKYFTTLQEFEAAFKEKIPAAIIMDMVFKEGDIAGAQAIKRIKTNNDRCPPVIFTSVRDDLPARLEAARAGAQRYFCKPFDVKKLSSTIQSLISNEVKEAYRVLCIDDDESLLSFYETALQSAGITVKTLANPLLALEVLAEFKPDVIIIDVYMPECTGPEIAQVIRQDESWALVPIMFLSTETDLNLQLDALNLGGDDFMMKPVQAGHLISAVTAKAKRARRTIYLNKELSLALRESEYQLITSNQHNIVSSTDVAGRITFVNDKFCEVSGYSQEELIGNNHRMLKSNKHNDAFYKELWGTITNGKVWRGIICNRNKDGNEYWVESTIVPFLDNKGKPYKYVSARTDITELREKEERLNRSQSFANIGTWDWNIKTGGLFWSERIWPLFGYTRSETDTTYENFMAAVHPDDRQKVGDAVTACVNERKEYRIEHRVVWPDGSVHWVLESGDVVRDENGEPLRMLGVVQDIDNRKRTELILAENEKQLVDAQALANIGNWKVDLSTGYLSWSDEIYRIFGYEPGSIEPSVEVFHSMIHPLDRDKVFESEKRAEETGFHDVEHRIIRPDGAIRYVHELAHAENDKDGNLLYMSGTVQDITERVEAEHKLRESEERFTFAVEGAGEGIWDWNLTTNVMEFSRVYMEMLGYAENELPSHVSTWINSVHPDDLARAQNVLQEYLEGKTPNYTIELRLRCKDGNYKWILCRGTVVERDADGKAVRMIGVHSDITERHEAENNLRQYNVILELIAKGGELNNILTAIVEYAENILKNAYCSILILDESGNYFNQLVAPSLPDFYNQAIEGLEIGVGVGSCGEAAFTGKRVVACDILEHQNWTAFRDVATKANLRACWSEPVFSSEGKILGTFAIYHSSVKEPDETELKITVELAQIVAIILERIMYQQALVDAKEDAEEANRAKSQFLSSMSHELRTPMNAIIGFSQLLLMETDDALSDSQKENVNEISKAGDHLLKLINEVLDLAKIEAGYIDLSIEDVMLAAVLSESLQLITPLAERRGITIELYKSDKKITVEDLFQNEIFVKADNTRLKQVLLNLLSNAVKYNNQNGRITISCNETEDNKLRISITDTGNGLSEEQQAELFKSFSRPGNEQGDIEGTGIGLVITKNIVELMGGTIGLDSKVNQGSTFWFELEMEKEPVHEDYEDEKMKVLSSDENSDSADLQTVLYIEDNPANLRLVSQLLGRLPNLQIKTAHEPLLGIELAMEHRPELILLDINLPGINGFEVLEHLRGRKETRDIPVVAISANAMPKDIEKGLQAGFDDYVTKPINISLLLQAVNEKLGRV